MPRALKTKGPPTHLRSRRRSVQPLAHPATPQGLVQDLLEWFRNNARELPWRKTRHPYAIWVSEIMLQQTQVRTVIPYWESWMKTFPTPTSLAAASEPAVLKLWEGLGYYRRARNLHKAAQMMVELHGGQFPSAPEDILNLPGVGRYTLGAIGSIAFNLPLPILDGNVARVLSRLHMQSADPSARTGADWYWKRSEALVQMACALPSRHQPALSGNCSALNQALMELGATVCTPKSPCCSSCPIQRHCLAFKHQEVNAFPPPKIRPTITRRCIHAWIVLNSSRTHMLVRQRPAQDINGGFWEFPEVELEPAPKQNLRSPKATPIPDPSKHVGFNSRILSDDRLRLKHGITRYCFEITATLHEPDMTSVTLPKPAQGLSWVSRAEMLHLPLTTAHRKLFKSIPSESIPESPDQAPGRKRLPQS